MPSPWRLLSFQKIPIEIANYIARIVVPWCHLCGATWYDNLWWLPTIIRMGFCSLFYGELIFSISELPVCRFCGKKLKLLFWFLGNLVMNVNDPKYPCSWQEYLELCYLNDQTKLPKLNYPPRLTCRSRMLNYSWNVPKYLLAAVRDFTLHVSRHGAIFLNWAPQKIEVLL